MSDPIIPAQQDLPGLVAVLSEQISEVKSSIDGLRQGLSDGLRHLEVRLDDHAVRITTLERSEIRREESEAAHARMMQIVEQHRDNQAQDKHVHLSGLQVKIAFGGLLLTFVTIIASELHQLWG